MELKDFKKDVVRAMTKEEFESTINEDIKFVEGFKYFLRHDDATRIVEHIKSVLEASVDYYYPNHPEPKTEPGDMGEVSDDKNLDHITFKGDGKESFSFNRVLVENLIETFETMQDIYSDNYRLKVYTGNCIIQLNANPKDPSKSFFDVYDRDEMKLIYGIKISILKEMFGICI